MSFLSHPLSPNYHWVYSKVGVWGQDQSCYCSGHVAAGERARVPLSGGLVPFLSLCPSLRTLCAQPAQGSQQKTPSLSSVFLVNTVSLSSRTCCSPSLHFWGHLWAGFSGTSRVLCLGQSWGLWLLPGPWRNTFEENLRKQSARSRWIVVEWMGLLPSGNPREQEWVYMFSYLCTWQSSHSVHLKTNSDSVPGYFYTATGNTKDVFVLREKHCFQGCLLE